MPELPEVETIRRQLEPRLSGRTFEAGDAHPSTKFSPALDALGAMVTGVDRRGKYLLIGLDDDRELVAHLGMTGSFHFAAAGDATHPPACADHDPYVRAVWRLDNGEELVFRDVRRFGRLRVVPAGDYTEIPTLRTIGPEPLTSGFDGRSLVEAVRKSSRPIKTQLLSQRPVAGVGNIYADEALFLARIHPQSRRLGRARADRLARALKQVLQSGIDHGGTTLRDYVNADGAIGSNQHELMVYGRAGEPCPVCGHELASRVIDARTATFCRRCQRP
ncbi:MAG: bifunctional DNA-formamidopyrimidine glycosylase/DNA-(apurinic or apyrimidinic site) lyase [Acidimicrobiia bacterium]|nr:bifunctional DNA-formamidopyrimidine glycosylase/DNA-(apurinic or apyrimidinic site) lyase [Acidimicrobiia bacterium]